MIWVLLGFVLRSGNAYCVPGTWYIIWGIGVEYCIARATVHNINTHWRNARIINTNKLKYNFVVWAGRCYHVMMLWCYDVMVLARWLRTFYFCLHGLFSPFRVEYMSFRIYTNEMPINVYNANESLVGYALWGIYPSNLPGYNLPTSIYYPVPQYRSPIAYPSPYY